MPTWAFGLMVFGGLWLCLWTSRQRLLGLIPVFVGGMAAWSTQAPDVLITGDGRHLAIVSPDGQPMMLRERSGDFTQDLMSEAAGFDDVPGLLASAPFGTCSKDSCVAVIRREGREWRLLATRTSTRINWQELTKACADADIVVSDRRLPRGCEPRWLKLDRQALSRAGGVALYLGSEPRAATVSEHLGKHSWALTEP